jgi:hypothetical protein
MLGSCYTPLVITIITLHDVIFFDVVTLSLPLGSGTVVPSMTTMVSKYGKTAVPFNNSDTLKVHSYRFVTKLGGYCFLTLKAVIN